MRRLSAPYAVFAVLLMAGIALPAATAAASAAPVTSLSVGPAGSIIPATASNWAGYAAISSNHTVSKVSATWVEPTVTCTSKDTYAVFWVGLDGATSPSVEQTGTFAMCIGGVASYEAWWEIYPVNSIQPISSITVHPGDSFTASVTYSTSTAKFTMKITDTTTGATFTKAKAYASAWRANAECIAERPATSSGLLPLANFGKVTFKSCDATISGTNAGIGTFSTVYQINMATTSKTLATTGALTSSKTFKVTWKASG